MTDASGHPIERWAVRRLGIDDGRLTTTALREGLPHLEGLQWDKRTASRLGGRLANHLVHLEAEQAVRWMEAAERFLAETPRTSAAGPGAAGESHAVRARA